MKNYLEEVHRILLEALKEYDTLLLREEDIDTMIYDIDLYGERVGSFTCNSYEAKKMLLDNKEYVEEVLDVHGLEEKDFKDEEDLDTFIRRHTHDTVVNDVIIDLEEELKELLQSKLYNDKVNTLEDIQHEEEDLYNGDVVLTYEDSLEDIVGYLSFIGSSYEGIVKNLSYDLYHDYVVYLEEEGLYLYVIG